MFPYEGLSIDGQDWTWAGNERLCVVWGLWTVGWTVHWGTHKYINNQQSQPHILTYLPYLAPP